MPYNLIREFRLEQNISKKELAKSAETYMARLKNIENGASASAERYALLALALDVPIDELYPEQESEWPEIEKKKQFIDIQRQINLEELEKQIEEKERLDKEIAKKQKEEKKIKKNLHKINKEHESQVRDHEELTDRATKNRILRELNFPPEYQTAGMTILQGFVKLINKKYNSKDVTVTIKQSGLKVILIIKTPDGKTEEVEEFLDQYSLVIAGDKSINTMTNDPVLLIELKGQLDIAKLQIKQQRDINLLLKTNHDRRIEDLEKENEWFREQFSLSIESSKSVTTEILSQLKSNDTQIATLANQLVNIIEESSKTKKEISAVGSKADAANKTIEELNKQILKDGIGKGVSDSIRKLIKWATLHLIT